MERRKNYSRAGLEKAIVEAFEIEIEHGRPNEFTMYGIARKLLYSPSIHLTKTLNRMVDNDILTSVKTSRKGRYDTVIYSLKTAKRKPVKKSRKIDFKVNGKHEEQLEMFE